MDELGAKASANDAWHILRLRSMLRRKRNEGA